MKLSCFFLLGVMAFTACRPSAPVSFSSALDGLTDSSRLSSPPAGKAFMISSYDRTGGNADHRNFQGTDPNGNYVLADLKGPGCLTRLWFTGIPESARLNFFFDGEKVPRLSLTVIEIKSGEHVPFVRPLCSEPSGALISYAPLPYSKRLKITVTPDKEGFYYYQINYTKLPSQTSVSSLTLPLSKEETRKLQETCNTWQHPEKLFTIGTAGTNDILIPPAQEVVLLNSNEQGLLTEWALAVVNNERKIPSQLVLKMYWDGMSRPSVEVPLGDFFCNPLRPREFTSVLLARTNETYHSRFPMPFRHGARITLTNQSEKPVTVRFNATQIPPPSGPVFYFHASWNQATQNRSPFRLVQINGNGYFAGLSLLEYATGRVSWNILEGDELFTVDRDAGRTFYGTGLEDYFNGGWYYNGGTFLEPLFGLTERSAIKTAQYRFHLDAPISFKKQFAASFEFGDGNTSDGCFSGTAYWYQDKPSAVKNLPPAAARRRPPDPLEQQAFMCEIFETERKTNTAEAVALCQEYTEKYPGTADAEMLLLRAQAYQADQQSARADQLLGQEKPSAPAAVRNQATLLKKFYADPAAALISAHVNGTYSLYLDGKPILNGQNMTVQQTALADLPPGSHTLTMKVTWTQPDNWIDVHLRTHSTNLWSGTDWECAQQPDAAVWKSCVSRGVLPKMNWIRFEPNAMVYTQHHPLTGPQPGWDALGKTCWFRKTFEIKSAK